MTEKQNAKSDSQSKAPMYLGMVLSAFVAIAVWEGIQQLPSEAHAQARNAQSVLNASSQRREIIAEQKKTNSLMEKNNAKLDQLIKLLKSGKVKVQTEPATQTAPRKRRK